MKCNIPSICDKTTVTAVLIGEFAIFLMGFSASASATAVAGGIMFSCFISRMSSGNFLKMAQT